MAYDLSGLGGLATALTVVSFEKSLKKGAKKNPKWLEHYMEQSKGQQKKEKKHLEEVAKKLKQGKIGYF